MLTRSKRYLWIGTAALVVGLLAAGGAAAAQEGHGPAVAPAQAGTEPAPHEQGARRGAPNPLEPQPTLAIWTLVVFVGLMFVLGRFAWKPLLLGAAPA